MSIFSGRPFFVVVQACAKQLLKNENEYKMRISPVKMMQ